MPEWIHNRAEHILAKNPDMKKSTAFAVATQQAHAIGKSPKGYGTAEGRHEAKAKYDTPKDDKKTANPGGLSSPKMEKKSNLGAAAFQQGARAGASRVPGIGPGGAGLLDAASQLMHGSSAEEAARHGTGKALQAAVIRHGLGLAKTSEAVMRAEAFYDELSKIAAIPRGEALKMMGVLGGIGALTGAASGANQSKEWKQYAKDHKDSRVSQFLGKHPVLTSAAVGGLTTGALPLLIPPVRKAVGRDIKGVVNPVVHGIKAKLDKHVALPLSTAMQDVQYGKAPIPEVENLLAKFNKPGA